MYDPTLIDITETHVLGENREFSIDAGIYPVSHDGEAGSIWTIVKRNDSRIVIHLINLIDQVHDRWNESKNSCTSKPSITFQIPRYSDTLIIHTANPERSCGKASLLSHSDVSGVRGPSVSVELDTVGLWTTVWCEL